MRYRPAQVEDGGTLKGCQTFLTSLTNKDCRTLRCDIVKLDLTLNKEFWATTGVFVSIETLRTESHHLEYPGCAAAHKPHKTKYKVRTVVLPQK